MSTGANAGSLTRRAALKGAVGLGGAFAGSALLGGCLNSPSQSSGGSGKGPVEFWFPYGLVPPKGEKQNTYGKLMNQFNDKHPGQQVKVSTGNWDPAKLVTAVSGGDPPDLFYMDRYLAAEWAARNVIEPLNDRLDNAQTFSQEDIWPKLLQDVTMKDRVFGIPVYTDVRSLYWNKSVFQAAGLDPERAPETWDDQKTMIKALYRRGDQLGFAPTLANPPGFLMWFIYLWQLGGDFATSDNTKVAFNNDAGVGAMQYMLDTFDLQGGYEAVVKFASALSPGPGQDPFTIGKIGMTVADIPLPVTLERYAPDLHWGLGALPIPNGGQKANYNGGHALVIPKGAKNPDGAWAVIEWLLDKDHQAEIALNESAIPAREDVANGAYLKGNSGPVPAHQRKLFIEEFQHSKWVPVIPGVSQVFDVLQRTWEQIMRRNVTPRAGISDMASQCQPILDQAQQLIKSMQ